MKNYILTKLALFLLATQVSLAQNYGGGTLVVLNKSDNSVSLFDLKESKEIKRIPVGIGPHEVAIYRNIAAVSIYGDKDPGSSLCLIDLNKQEKIGKIDLAPYQRPHGIVFLPNGKEILVTVEANKAVLKIDIASRKIIEVIETAQESSHMIAYAPANQRAFTANIGSGTVSVLDMDKNKKLFDIPTGKGSEGLAINRKGESLWVTNRAENTISIIDTRLLKVVQSINTDNFPIRAAFTVDDKMVLVSNAKSGNIEVFDAQNFKKLHTIPISEMEVSDNQGRMSAAIGTGPIPIGILMHPNGKYAFIANTNADIVTVLDLEKMNIAGRIATGKEPDGLGIYMGR